jgi:short-subunit dehydrogenase
MKPLAAITGASAGIGAEFARQLAARGCSLILIARREDRLRELAASLPQTPCTIVTADLATDSGVDHAIQILAQHPALHYLVNNAGFGTKGLFHETAAEGQDTMHRLHVLAAERLTRAVLPRMVEQNRGGIINVSSIAGFLQSAGGVSYCATKAWMNLFTEGLHLELRSIGSAVRVQALCPGYTLSEFHDVLGMDRARVPGGLWLKAERVVRESLEGLDRGQLFVIPDWRYRLTVTLAQFTPRWIRHDLAIRAGRRLGRT